MIISLGFLLLAATLGSWLAVSVAQGGANGWKVPLVHGLIGAGGLLVLILALGSRHRPVGAGMGLAGFGTGAEILLALALLFGLTIVRAGWNGRRPSGLVIGTHAMFAIGGIVMVLAIASLR